MRYRFHEGDVEIPDGYIAAPVQVLHIPHPEGPLELTMVRIEAHDADLAAAVDDHTTKIRRELPRFELVHRRDVSIDGRPVVDRAIRFATADGAMYQRIAAAALGDRLLLVAVAATPRQQPSVDDLFARVVESARWRDGRCA